MRKEYSASIESTLRDSGNRRFSHLIAIARSLKNSSLSFCSASSIGLRTSRYFRRAPLTSASLSLPSSSLISSSRERTRQALRNLGARDLLGDVLNAGPKLAR